ncbi:hypothetical protein CAPTEDRAFT_225262 [Capitella teleta]|uniref:PH domain-containing protein n=1 Tax=Capitella teleta TaxID=283909 RepID=R7U5L9_CAPTE|nr:hypothetical protein CAPTEDRAFT_225262 [Capitella teleta]|eukprot:ELT98435.1 hypothetical protein CAPTEDRAFT_225262 [Capitella teleta]
MNIGYKQQLLDVRRRSLSAGSLPLPLVEHLRQSCHDRLLPRRRRPRCPVEVAASQIDPKSKVGWLLVEDEALWKSSWCILSDRILFFFENPDSPKAFDCFNLLGWSLTSRLQGHSLALHHQDFHAVNMKAQQQSDLEQWEAQLRTATQRVTIEGLNLERGNSAEFDDDRDRLDAATVASQREWQQEFVQLKKQKLLQEVLQQKSRIERQQRQLQGSPTSVPEIQVSPLSGSDQELRYHGDKHIVDLVRLRQRKVSTQLKVDGIQRALHGRPNHKKKPKKRGFLSMLSGDGGSSDESLNEFNVTNDDKQGLQLQLRDLHRQLEDINNTIMIKQSERLQLGDDKLKSRSTSNLARFSRDSSGVVACSSEDSFERTSSSESMHKLMKAQQVKKMAISELIDFRQKLKIADAPPNLRHSWSPSAFENFKISKGERKLDRQSPMTCSQEFTPPPPPPRRSMGGKHKSLTSLSPRFPSPEVESNRNKLQISEDAMAKIAAFEELLQENMVM